MHYNQRIEDVASELEMFRPEPDMMISYVSPVNEGIEPV